MAIMTADNVAVQAQGFGSLPAIRQLALMVGLAISVALGVTVAMWSQTPNYSLLYGNLSARDLSEVTRSLDNSGIQYKLDSSSGGILVPAEQLHQARIRLASTGVSLGGDVGFEMMDKDQGLGSNSFLLKARYQRALEGELAQTISKLKIIESARVHLAIPKKSAFARASAKPAASVVLNLYAGRNITDMQTAGIVNIVASSIPGMEPENVTVVDERGRLLSSSDNDTGMNTSSSQFDYTRKLEDRYVKRILDIISPIVGAEGVRAQVVADINFTSLEETKESYAPDRTSIRSEQLFEQNSNSPSTGGIPGALTNQAPAGGTTEATTAQVAAALVNSSTRALRNYEIDKTISHTRQSPTTLQRLSIAVIVDYRLVVGKKGAVTREKLSDEEIAFVSTLVKEAVGFNEGRGDTINVVNTQFKLPEAVEDLPEEPIWEQAWVLKLAKQVVGGLAVLLIAFGILRPMLSNLAKQGEVSAAALAALPTNDTVEHLPAGEDRLTLTNQNPTNGQQLMDQANTMVKEDPKRVAQVMSTWVAADE